MVEFKKIVLTSDFSPNSDAALPYAVELARQYNGTIYLVHVFEDAVYYASAAGVETVAFDPTEWIEAAREHRQKQLNSAAQSLKDREKVAVSPILRQGHVASEVLNVAKEIGADCVVIATHGRTGLSHLIFGSVAERVVRLSPCPVLSVRPKNLKTEAAKR